MIIESTCGEGKVYLLAGGGKIYTDTAAKFCRNIGSVEDIITSSTNKKIIDAIVNSSHNAALEFDDFIFGIEGHSRVTEIQLVRKRHASYMISSGRVNHNGKRPMKVVIPEEIKNVTCRVPLPKAEVVMTNKNNSGLLIDDAHIDTTVYCEFNYRDILDIIDSWYDVGIQMEVPEEFLRYMTTQSTEFKGAIKMNASALHDWAKIRMCYRAQSEIRSLANKMISLVKEASPELFENIGPSCKVYGYCPEGEQCNELKGKVPTKAQAMKLLHEYRGKVLKY